MKLKVLVADDDVALRSLICDILNKQGYQAIPAIDGDDALEKYYSEPDLSLLILDVMMPGASGFEVLSQVRDLSEVPVLMLTALGDESNEITGFTGGANDYISKPFSYPILIARVEALLRKAKRERTSDFSMGALSINRSAHQVFVNNRVVVLNNKEYQLLDLLASNRGIVLERSKILDTIWGYDYDGDDKTINTHIKMLRSKLGDCAAYIITIKGTGYMLDER